MNRQISIILTAAVFLLSAVGSASAQGVTPQTLLPGALIPQFVDPLPVAGDISVVNAGPAGTPAYQITMSEFQAQILPATFINPATNLPYGPSWVWGYLTTGDSPDVGRPGYLGPVVFAKRGTQTTPTYINALPFGLGSNVQRLLPIDQTLDWAAFGFPYSFAARRSQDRLIIIKKYSSWSSMRLESDCRDTESGYPLFCFSLIYDFFCD